MGDLRTLVVMERLPSCDFCRMKDVDRPARYDFRTLAGAWAYGCQEHYEIQRACEVLGTGHGQMLVTAAEMEVRL